MNRKPYPNDVSDDEWAILDSRTLHSSLESGPRTGYDEANRKRGNKVHVAVDTLGHLLALPVTAANERENTGNGFLCHNCPVGVTFSGRSPGKGVGCFPPEDTGLGHSFSCPALSDNLPLNDHDIVPGCWADF